MIDGRDGVVTDTNGLFYMRARYYSPDMRRFVNADIIAGEISEAITLNRYAYANGNPVSNVDPFGLSSKETKFDFKAEFDRFIEIVVDVLTVSTVCTIVWKIAKFQPQLAQTTSAVACLAALAVIVYSCLPSETQVSLIEKISGVTREEHYGRLDKKPDNYPDPYSQSIHENYDKYKSYLSSLGWKKVKLSSCHQFTSPDQSNIKYVTEDEKYEIIFDKNYNIVYDVRDIGTYNRKSPISEKLGHFQEDVLPWIFWGNSADDSTTIEERVNAFFIDGFQETIKNLFE